MPELPEVETIRRQLSPYCQSETIADITFSKHAPALLQNCTGELFRAALRHTTVRELSRKGKYLVLHCDGMFPVFHLGMSGIFLQDKSASRYAKHIHVDIQFTSGKHLFFQDMRRFGKIWLYDTYPLFPNLGVDPVTDMPTPGVFQEMLKNGARNIKLFLMDQHILAGIGNIYASEILHRARISPLRKTGELSRAESMALYGAINDILSAAIEKFGTTYSAYRTATGQEGQNQHFLSVYQRTQQPCKRCEAPIEKVMLGNRSTFYCPDCQR